MSDQLTQAPQLEEEAPAEEETPEGEVAEGEEGETEEEEHAIEFEGEKIPVPAKAKIAYEKMQAATTQKFQEAAEIRKAAEAKAQEQQEIDGMRAQLYREIAQVEQINEQLAQFDKVDWARWEREDPDAARNAKLDRIDLRDRRDGLVGAIRQKIDENTAKKSQETQKRRSAAEAEIRTYIPDWSPQRQEALGKLAENYGFSTQEFQNLALMDARMIRVLKDAEIGRRAQKSATAPPLKTVNTIPKVSGGGTPAQKHPDKMSITEYNAWRDRQEAAKRKAATKH